MKFISPKCVNKNSGFRDHFSFKGVLIVKLDRIAPLIAELPSMKLYQ